MTTSPTTTTPSATPATPAPSPAPAAMSGSIPTPAQTALVDGASPSMRLQLALNVDDLEQAVTFYSTMFNTRPALQRPGYANFAIADPPLKLVLFEGAETGTINHLGVETSTASQVIQAEQRFADDGIQTTGVDNVQCCFAEKTETWIEGPDSTRWEWYVRTGDAEVLENVSLTDQGSCCG